MLGILRRVATEKSWNSLTIPGFLRLILRELPNFWDSTKCRIINLRFSSPVGNKAEFMLRDKSTYVYLLSQRNSPLTFGVFFIFT